MRTRPQDQEGTRMISGSVSSAGVVVTGNGFLASKTATGNYLVRFPSARAVQAVTVSTYPGHGGQTAIHQAPDPSFDVQTLVNGVATDSSFNFEAVVLPR